MFGKKLSFNLLLLAVVLSGILFFLWKAQNPAKLNVVVIDICSARSDHFSFNGYNRQTTPNIDSFSKNAIIFKNSWTQANWCLPDFATLLTGTRPEVHTMLFPDPSFNVLSPSILTLAEVLKKAGYETAGFSGSQFLKDEYKLNRGFDSFQNPYALKSGMQMSSFEDSLPRVGEFLTSHKKSTKPFFLYMSVDDLHNPYMTDDPSMFDKGYSGIFDSLDSDHTAEMLSRSPGGNYFDRLYNNPDDPGAVATLDSQTLQVIKKQIAQFKKDPAELKHLIARYDASLHRADRLVGSVLAQLKKEYKDNTVIIITAHQGEYLGEHGLLGHSEGLNENMLNVPLLVYYPNSAKGPKAIENLVERIDIPATILDIAGIFSSYQKQFAGTSLLPLLTGQSVNQWKNYIFASSRPIRSNIQQKVTIDERAVRNSQYKLIWYSYKDKPYELYDLKADPSESSDISTSNTQVFNELKNQLENYVNSFL